MVTLTFYKMGYYVGYFVGKTKRANHSAAHGPRTRFTKVEKLPTKTYIFEAVH